jgi:hypothetical protein
VLSGLGMCLIGSAPAGGKDGDVLRMTVTTNSVSVPGVRIRAGQLAVRVYRLRNFAEYGLRGLGVRDPQVAGGSVRCPRDFLAPLGTMTCRAEVAPRPGRHLVRVTAAGAAAWEEYGRARASATAGYEVRPAVLTLRRTASQKRLFYRIAYAGPAALENLRLHDPLLHDPRLRKAAPLTCSSGAGLPRRLPAGGSVECWAPGPAGPGRHASVARVSGTAKDRAVSAKGARLPPLALSARAAAGYSVPVPPPPATRPSAPPEGGRPRPPGTAPTRGATPPPVTTPPGTAPPGAPPAGTPPRPAPRPPVPPRPPAEGTPPQPEPGGQPLPGAPPGGLPAPPPGDAAGPAGDAAAAPPAPPGAAGAADPYFLAAGPAAPVGPVPDAPPFTTPDPPPDGASPTRLPRSSALSARPSRTDGDGLMQPADWAVMAFLIVLIPAVLAAMSFDSRKSKSSGK